MEQWKFDYNTLSNDIMEQNDCVSGVKTDVVGLICSFLRNSDNLGEVRINS